MENTTKVISVWLDRTSDHEEPAWIVSLDLVENETGGSLETDTLHVFASEEDAVRAGRSEARNRGLPMITPKNVGRPLGEIVGKERRR